MLGILRLIVAVSFISIASFAQSTFPVTDGTTNNQIFTNGNGQNFWTNTPGGGFYWFQSHPNDALEDQFGCAVTLGGGCEVCLVPGAAGADAIYYRYHFCVGGNDSIFPGDFTMEHNAMDRTVALVIPKNSTTGSVVFPCSGGNTGGRCPIANARGAIFRDGPSVPGVDETEVGHTTSSVPFGGGFVRDVFTIDSKPTASGMGGILLNHTCFFNSAVGSGNSNFAAFECAPYGPAAGHATLCFHTNDGPCQNGASGWTVFVPSDPTGRGRIAVGHDGGADFLVQNHLNSTMGDMRISPGKVQIGSGGWGTFQLTVTPTATISSVPYQLPDYPVGSLPPCTAPALASSGGQLMYCNGTAWIAK